MLRASIVGVALVSTAFAQEAGGARRVISYVEEHAQPRIATVLGEFLQPPVDLLQWSLAVQQVDGSSVTETEAFRELCFAQLLSEVARGHNHVTMIYGGFADGRCIGYRLVDNSEYTFVFRAEGDAPATSADWTPWTLDTVNAQCSLDSACTPPEGRPVRPTDTSVRTVNCPIQFYSYC